MPIPPALAALLLQYGPQIVESIVSAYFDRETNKELIDAFESRQDLAQQRQILRRIADRELRRLAADSDAGVRHGSGGGKGIPGPRDASGG